MNSAVRSLARKCTAALPFLRRADRADIRRGGRGREGKTMPEMLLVALGANLPDASGRPALETCRWAAARLAGLPGLRLEGLSRWYRTAPVPASDQADYI